MMEDNEIAVMSLVAGEEVQDEIDEAERVERLVNGNAPHFRVQISVKCICERYVEEQQIKGQRHERVPIKPISMVETCELRVEPSPNEKFMEHLSSCCCVRTSSLKTDEL